PTLHTKSAAPRAPSPLSLHDALPISPDDGREHIDKRHRLTADEARGHLGPGKDHRHPGGFLVHVRFAPQAAGAEIVAMVARIEQDRKSTRLNSSHVAISYAVSCLTKK